MRNTTFSIVDEHAHEFQFGPVRVAGNVTASRADSDMACHVVVIQPAGEAAKRTVQSYLERLAHDVGPGERTVGGEHGERLAKGLLANGRCVPDDYERYWAPGCMLFNLFEQLAHER